MSETKKLEHRTRNPEKCPACIQEKAEKKMKEAGPVLVAACERARNLLGQFDSLPNPTLAGWVRTVKEELRAALVLAGELR